MLTVIMPARNKTGYKDNYLDFSVHLSRAAVVTRHRSEMI